MKTKSKCVGCKSIKLCNAMGLCKRCNRHAHDFISTDEMERFKRERELMLSATKAAKKAKKEEEEAKEEAKDETAAEGEEGGEEDKETGEAGVEDTKAPEA